MDDRPHDFGATRADYATGSGVGADLYEFAIGPAKEGSVSEADALESRARELRAQEARENEAEQDRVRFRDAAEAHGVAISAAAESLGGVIRNVVHISALLTWSPSKAEEADRLVALAARHLADFRSHLGMAVAVGAGLGTEHGLPPDPEPNLGEQYAATLMRMGEVHRQVGAMIALLESDMTNTPALVAMERSVQEAQAVSAVTSQGLGMALDQTGMTR